AKNRFQPQLVLNNDEYVRNLESDVGILHRAQADSKAQLAALVEDNGSLKSRLEISEAGRISDAAAARDRIEAVRAEAAARERELEAARLEAAGRERELKAARLEAAGRERELEAARSDAAARERELEAARSDAAARERELETARTRIAEEA